MPELILALDHLEERVAEHRRDVRHHRGVLVVHDEQEVAEPVTRVVLHRVFFPLVLDAFDERLDLGRGDSAMRRERYTILLALLRAAVFRGVSARQTCNRGCNRV